MSFSFWSSDFSAFVFGRAILKKNPKADLSFFVQQKSDSLSESFHESSLWETALRQVVKQSRFGRVGLVFDRKNQAAQHFCHGLSSLKCEYSQKNKRAEKLPRFSFLKIQLVHEMANEGLSDSVEFRRLARKYLRQAKHAHCDSLLFLETIFGETSTKKILQHIVGSQIKIYTIDDFLDSKAAFFVPTSKQKIEIKSDDSVEFTKKRAEEILKA